MKKILFIASVVLLGAGCGAEDPNPKVDGYAPSVDEPIEEVVEEKTEEEKVAPEIAPGKASTLETDDGSGIQSSKVTKPVVEDEPEDESADEEIAQPLPLVEPPVEPAEISAPVVKSFNITAKQWDFVPSTVTVNKGDTVRMTFTSTDVTHGVSLAAFGVNENLVPGKSVTVEFVADKAGNHSFICNVFCGSGHSHMSGTLVVK